MWEGPEGCMSKLLIGVHTTSVHITDLRIEPGRPVRYRASRNVTFNAPETGRANR